MKSRLVGYAIRGLAGLAMLGLAATFPGCRMNTEVVEADSPSRVLLQEEFTDNSNNWFVGTVLDLYHFEIVDGEYFLRSLSDSGIVAKKFIPIPEAGSFDLRVSLKLYKTDKDLGYGFCWGGSDWDNRYCFYISRDLKYTLFRRRSGQIQDYVAWTGDSRLHADENALEIRRRGQSLKYLINGKEVGTIAAESFFGDQLYFAADGKQDVGIQSLLILVEQ